MPSCKHCGARFPTDAVDRALGVGQCQMCGEVSELGEDLPTAPVGFAPDPDPAPDPVDALEQAFDEALVPREAADSEAWDLPPRGWDVVSAEPLLLRRRWVAVDVVFVAAFALYWNWTVLGQAPLPAALFTPVAWPGLSMLWYLAARVLNQTVISSDGRTLSVRHGPIPWIASGAVDVVDVDQLHVELAALKINKRPRWNLMATDGKGRKHVVIRWIADVEDARWLEGRFEHALGLVDRPMGREISRP